MLASWGCSSMSARLSPWDGLNALGSECTSDVPVSVRFRPASRTSGELDQRLEFTAICQAKCGYVLGAEF